MNLAVAHCRKVTCAPAEPRWMKLLLPAKFESRRAWNISFCKAGEKLWRLGADSVCGPVRKENQDYVVAISRADEAILVVADGCGGLPYGAAASRHAAMTASSILASGKDESYEVLLERAFKAAALKLEGIGRELAIDSLAGGLRTTLIAAIAAGDRLHIGYIGDGACDLVLCTGEVEQLIVPHRPESGDASSLEASLGPTPHGTAEFRSVPRPQHSFVFCGTDGVFDRIPAAGFHHAVLGLAIRLGGDLAKAVTETLGEFALARDEMGYVCDDNMSLGIIGPGTPPKFTKGFWNHASL